MATILGYDNHVITGTIETGSSIPSLPPENLQSPHGDTAHSFQGAPGNLNFSIRVNAGNVGTVWQLFGLFRTNLTPSATVRWQVGSETWITGGGGSPVYDTGEIPAGITAGFGQTVHIAPSPVTEQWCRCVLNDPTNPDGFLSVALMYAGTLYKASGVSSQSEWVVDVGEDQVTTRGGQEYLTPRFSRRAWNVRFPSTPSGEVYPQVAAMMSASRRGENVLFVPFSDADTVNQDAVFGRYTPSGGIGFSNQTGLRRTWGGKFSERL